MDIKETEYEGMGWIHLAQDTVQWRTILNTVMSIRVSQSQGTSRAADQVSTFQGRSCTMELGLYNRGIIKIVRKTTFRVV